MRQRLQSGDARSDSTGGRRGIKTLAVAITIGQICALVRYTLLARLLGPEELGLAVTIVLSAQFFDSVTDSGSDRFLILDRDGDAPAAQRLVQLVALSRGVLIAILLCIMARPIAAFYNSPSLVFGLTLLAAAPLLGGLIHLDLRRMQRHHDFRIEAVAAASAEVASLVATTAYALFSHSYLAIVFGLIVRSVVLVGLSHILAKRRYAIGFSAALAKRVALFGAPLLVNGLLLFFGSQSDRLFIGRYMGLGELGRYSSLILLIFYPLSVMQKFVGSIYLPQLTMTNEHRHVAAEQFGGLVVVLSVTAATGFALVAPFAAPLLFGPRFGHSLYIIALVGVLSTMRFARSWPTNVALGMGRSGIVLTNNVIRLAGIPIALLSVYIFHTLSSILLGLIVGEFVALVVCLALVHRAAPRSRSSDIRRAGTIALASTGIVVGAWGIEHDWVPALPIAALCLATTLLQFYTGERSTLAWLANKVRAGVRRLGG
jgi:O-antigen/teichoic acid export membrane protein